MKSACSPSGHREHEVEARVALARHEPLLAVQDPLVLVPLGRGRDGADVGAGAGLGDGPGLAELAAQDRADELLALRGRGDVPELGRAAVDDDEAEAVRGLAGLLLQRHLAEHGEPAAAGLLGHVQHGEALGPRLAAQLAHPLRVDVAGLGDALLERVDLGLEERRDARLQLADVRGQLGNGRDHREILVTACSATARVPSRIASSALRGLRQSPASARSDPARRAPRRGRAPARGPGRGRAGRRGPRSRAPVRRGCGSGRRLGPGAGEVEVVRDPDARAVEPLRVEVRWYWWRRLAEGGRADGERDLRARLREQVGGGEAGRVAAPVGHDDPRAFGERPGEDVPGLHRRRSRRGRRPGRRAGRRWRRPRGPGRARRRRPGRRRRRGAGRRPRGAACSSARASARPPRASARRRRARAGRRSGPALQNDHLVAGRARLGGRGEPRGTGADDDHPPALRRPAPAGAVSAPARCAGSACRRSRCRRGSARCRRCSRCSGGRPRAVPPWPCARGRDR